MESSYAVRFLRRWPLGTRYPAIVADVVGLLACPPLPRSPLAIDQTGVGRPVVGDPVYGRRDDPHRGRPALHARRLRLVHPADGAERVFESPLPDDLEALLDRARRGAL